MVRLLVEVIWSFAILVLILERVVPEMWVSHSTTHRAATPAASAWLEVVHPKAAAVMIKSRHLRLFSQNRISI